jgi:DNA polymerase-3 subunit gamma/tau
VTRNKVSGGNSISGAPVEETRRITELGAKLSVPQLARTWQLLLKALSEVQSAPDAAAAAEMAMVRIGYASELPPTEQIVRNLGSGQGAGAAPRSAPAASASATPPSPPPPRASAPRNETVMSQVAAPAARTSAEPAAVAANEGGLNSFRDVVEFVRQKREMRLLFALENWVHLVAFEPGRIEMRVAPAAPATLPGEISDRLSKWTGQRWIVSVSGAEGEPTITEQRIAHEKARLEAAQQDPLLKAAMAAFPGARIIAVRDRDEFAAPTEGGDNE